MGQKFISIISLFKAALTISFQSRQINKDFLIGVWFVFTDTKDNSILLLVLMSRV